MMRANSPYARRNPFGGAFDNGGQVGSNVGAGAQTMQYTPPSQGWSGTSQGYGGSGKGGGYGMGKGGGMGGGMGGMYNGYGTNYAPNYNQQFNVPAGYFSSVSQYNPLLYAGLMNFGQPRPWQYGNPLSQPLFQSQNTFNQAQPQPTPQPQSGGGGGGFSILPNFDQNGQIISIPQGVTWGTPDSGGAPNWIYNGSHTSETMPNMPGAFGSPGAIPLNQYTGPGPWGGGTGGGNASGDNINGGVGGYTDTFYSNTAPPGSGGGGGSGLKGSGQSGLNATQIANGPPTSMAAAAPAPMNPWEGIGGFHAKRGGRIR